MKNKQAPIPHELLRQLQRNQEMKKKVQQHQEAMSAKGSPQRTHQNLKNSDLGGLMPGNVGDINKVVWPFWYTFTAPELSPGVSSNGSFTTSQEAAYIWLSFTCVVFKRTGIGPNYDYSAIDVNDESANGDINGLNIVFRDAQSSRVFQKNPMPIEAVGNPQFPTVLRSPVMFLPNSTVECLFTNNDSTNVYVPFVTFFGYRVRIQDAQNILSLITE